MLFVVFQLGPDRYAIDASRLEAVLPVPRLKALPQAPAGVVGLLNYHGESVPVVDLCALALGRPAASRLSTRLLLARYALPEGDDLAATATTPFRWLGLIAENATSTLQRAAADFRPAGIATPHARFLGPVAADADGFIQRIELDALLTPELHALLFQPDTLAGNVHGGVSGPALPSEA